jgi:hypothetical protein
MVSATTFDVTSVLAPYGRILTELNFKLVWTANLPHLRRERYEREDLGRRLATWIFLEANDSEVLWTMGWNMTSAYDMVASSVPAACQGLKLLTAFNEKLKLLAAGPTALTSGCIPD